MNCENCIGHAGEAAGKFGGTGASRPLARPALFRSYKPFACIEPRGRAHGDQSAGLLGALMLQAPAGRLPRASLDMLFGLHSHEHDQQGRHHSVGAWLRALGLGEYEATFREDAINEIGPAEPDGSLGTAASSLTLSRPSAWPPTQQRHLYPPRHQRQH